MCVSYEECIAVPATLKPPPTPSGTNGVVVDLASVGIEPRKNMGGVRMFFIYFTALLQKDEVI